MTVPTSSELTLLRSHPQETQLWMSIYQPRTVLACRVNNISAAPGDRLITYDGVTAGSYLQIESGMTMYIGTSLGAKDLGRIRVRSATSSVITIAENSDINWQDNLYLTIVKFWEIDAVYPRIVASGTVTYWYKDYDVAYSNQNDLLGTFVCMGSHYAGFVDNATGTVYYTATGTLSLLGATPLTYEWFFEGATVTGSSSETPGNRYYSTPGHYTTRLKVTDTNGVVDTSYRHVSIYDRPGFGSNVPILNWAFTALDGSRDNGGYNLRLAVRDDITNISDGSLIIIFADDRYGTTIQSIGGNSKNRQTIVFVGYILDGSISYNYQTSVVEFEVGSPTEVMKLAEGFSVAINSSVDPSGQAASDEDIPSGWVLVKDMDCRRAIYHYLKWHSTTLFTNDFQFMGTDREIKYFDADRQSIFDSIDMLMKGTLIGSLCSDRQGKLWSEVGIEVTNGAISGSFPNSMLLDRQDWMGTPVIDEVLNKQISYLEVGGVSFESATGTSTPFLCSAPGVTPSYRGRVEQVEGLALSTQAQLNTLAGNLFAYKNARYPQVDFGLVGNYRHIDIAPQETIRVNLEASDTPMGIVWNQKLFHPTSITWEYNPRQGTFLPRITLHEVTQGVSAITEDIPPAPPNTDPGGGGFDIPPIIIPPFGAPVTLLIYHNGVFVCTANALNFIDDNCS